MITNRCDTYILARLQQRSERERGLDESGISGYKKQGCIGGCDGFDRNCSKHRTDMGLGALILEEFNYETRSKD